MEVAEGDTPAVYIVGGVEVVDIRTVDDQVVDKRVHEPVAHHNS